MRFPRIAPSIACVMALLPLQSLNAEPMGGTSLATVQIFASVAPRVQITGVAPTDGSSSQLLCVASNAPAQTYTIRALDGSGTEVASLVTMPASALCQSGLKSEQSLLKLAASADTPTTLLITPQ